jgi:hypothetical protein
MQDAAARVLAIAALLLHAVIPIEFCGYALKIIWCAVKLDARFSAAAGGSLYGHPPS